MNKQEINIYREIQRNTEMAVKALEAVTDKIYQTGRGRACIYPRYSG